jgi:hypothetical protein
MSWRGMRGLIRERVGRVSLEILGLWEAVVRMRRRCEKGEHSWEEKEEVGKKKEKKEEREGEKAFENVIM